ncbi:unnamed protein product [Coregonus sp. 'balchen']|nr:unnamed protein product [Coregonus sp. 'balchen']
MKLRLHFVVDPMGWFCISMVFAIWLYNSFFVPKLVLLPHFYEGHIPWALVVKREQWEMCTKCNMMRPKRSHHCSRCGHCVRRMDHHCPWINNCVGEDNHWLFLQLCFYTQVLSLFTLALDFCQFYYFQPLTTLDQEAFMARHELALIRVSASMGLVIGGSGGGSNKSWQRTLAEVFGTTWKILWFIPLRSRQPLTFPHHFRSHV